MVFRLQKDVMKNGASIWVSSKRPDLWCGIKLNKDGKFKGTYTVITTFGLQPKPFKNRADGIKFIKEWMKEMETMGG